MAPLSLPQDLLQRRPHDGLQSEDIDYPLERRFSESAPHDGEETIYEGNLDKIGAVLQSVSDGALRLLEYGIVSYGERQIFAAQSFGDEDECPPTVLRYKARTRFDGRAIIDPTLQIPPLTCLTTMSGELAERVTNALAVACLIDFMSSNNN